MLLLLLTQNIEFVSKAMHKFVQRVLHCLIQRPLCNLCILHIVQFPIYFRFLQINWVDFIQGWLLLTFALNKLCIVNISGAPPPHPHDDDDGGDDDDDGDRHHHHHHHCQHCSGWSRILSPPCNVKKTRVDR